MKIETVVQDTKSQEGKKDRRTDRQKERKEGKRKERIEIYLKKNV